MTTVVLVQQGGTGANSASAARAALGAYSNSGGTISGQVAITGSGLALNVANNVFFGSNVAIGAQVENFPLYVERASLGVTSVFLSQDGVLNPRVVIYGNNQGSVIQHTYSANASNLLFSMGGSLGDGVEAMRITETRNVGIGVANPTAKLHVNGSAIFSQDVTVTGNLYLQGNTTYINVATLNVNDPLIYLASNNDFSDTVDIGFVGAKNTSGVYSHTGFARDATDGKWKLFDGLPEEDHINNVINFANTYLATLVANVEANTLSVVNGVTGNVNFNSGTLFVDAVNDRVGVGTSTPVSKFEVSGSTPKIAITNSGTRRYTVGVTNTNFIITDESAVSERMRITSAGNIGIGTTNPTDTLGYGRALDIQSNAGAAVYLRDSDNTGEYTSLGYEGGSAKNFSIYNTAAGDVRIYTSGSQRLTVSSSGNVGIGNTAPASKLTVAGTIESTTGGVKFPDGTTQTTAASAAADPIPSGTTMLFVQTSAPTGWTKSTTHNDKALRVVSGSVSTGGSVAFTSAFASQSVAGSISSTTQGGTVSTSVSGSVSGSVGSTTLSTSEMPSHGHSATDNGVGITIYDSSAVGGGPYGTVARAATQSAGAGLSINATGGGGSHNHSWSGSFSGSASSTFTGSSHGHTFTGTAINLAVQYVDVIIATKN